MYAKVYEQIFDSSIAENCRVRHLFEDLLKLCDRNGIVDMTHEAIARRTNVPLDEVRTAITELEKPDHRSRRPNEEGRRIVRLDPHRDWGWHIVNRDYYANLRDEEDRTRYMREYIREYRANGKDKSRPVNLVNSGKDGLAKAEAEAQGETKAKTEDQEPCGFVSFWELWPKHPRKTNRKGCLAKWVSHRLEAQSEAILAGLNAWLQSEKWTKDGGQYIEAPMVFLNQERWNDLEAARSGFGVVPVKQLRRDPLGPEALQEALERERLQGEQP